MGLARSSSETLPFAAIGSAYPYDEQVGVTFTQDFSVLAFNVTAVQTTDSDGVGPGYLVNGLTNFGYWYQVGLAYNWPFRLGGVNPGFNMLYAVFDPFENSIDPANGGGLQNFNGTVNAGDIVLLNLSFSSGHVVMRAMDWQTGATAARPYFAYGSRFVGLPSSLSTGPGFFTGLMTEQDHSTRYYGADVLVTYSDTKTSLSSVWMWMDEWNPDTGQSVFRDNLTSPVQLDSFLGRYFSSNGTAEVANAHGLVTGLTPIIFPTLSPGPSATGSPGHQALVPISIADPEGGTVRFAALNVSTSFGRYNFSLRTPFTLGTGDDYVTINVPASASPGNYNLTIDVRSWQYLDAQAQEWIPLQQTRMNETLVLTNNPPPSTNSGSTPPTPGQGPSTPTNKTTQSTISLLAVFRSLIIPVAAAYAALGLLAAVLLMKQERKRSTNSQIPSPRFCQRCGMEVSPGGLTCPSCGPSTDETTGQDGQVTLSPYP